MKTLKIRNNIYPIHHIINGSNIYLYYIPNKTIYASAMITGAKYKENKDTCGISHLLEHVLTNAYKKCNYIKCAPYLQNLGVNYNASTSNNYIQYFITGLSDDKYKILNYLIDIINYPIIKKENVDFEKKAVRSELLGYINNKYYKLQEEFAKKYYKNSAIIYNQNFRQQLKNLSKISEKELREWYNNNYNNITYFIIGDFNRTNILDYFKSNFPVKNPRQISISPQSIFSFNNEILFIKNNKQKLVYFLIAFPLKIEFSNPKFPYLKILCSILQKLLFLELRTNLHLIYGIVVSPSINLTSISINININVSIEKAELVIGVLFKMIEELKKDKLSEDRFIGYKKKFRYANNNSILNNTNGNIFSIYNEQIFFKSLDSNYKIRNINDYNKIIDGVNQKLFLDFMRDYFNLKTVFIAYQSPIEIL